MQNKIRIAVYGDGHMGHVDEYLAQLNGDPVSYRVEDKEFFSHVYISSNLEEELLDSAGKFIAFLKSRNVEMMDPSGIILRDAGLFGVRSVGGRLEVNEGPSKPLKELQPV